ncbi:MAG: chemotaxis protein CheA [Nitrospirota bacterium]|jgi:two-component system chemotaxis sensor kinase CheA
MKSSESDFIAECEDILEEAGRLLLDIQDGPGKGVDPDLVNALFRAMHTLKGLGGLFGRQDISEISHALESLLDDIRLGKVELGEEGVNLFFKYTDILRSLVNKPGGEGAGVDEYLAEIASFRESLSSGKKGGSLAGLIEESILKVLTEYEEHRLRANLEMGRGIYMVRPHFPITEFDTALTELTEKIKSAGELISTMPIAGDIPEGSIGFNLMFGSAGEPEALGRILERKVDVVVEAGKEVEREAAPSPETPGTPAEPAKAESALEAARTSSSMVRVDIDKLDRILNTIGELGLVKSAIGRIWSEMAEHYGHSSLVIDIYRVSQTMERKLKELQGQMLEIRMVPVGQIYGRLAQVIRRYSREAGKKIDLGMYGEDTEIDKYLAEEVVDPLVHIVRNAIDHGLEPEEERRAAGKPAAGSVKLRAFQRGNHVVMEVTDDGRGIDPAEVRRKALEGGIMEEGAVLTDKEAMELIFMPGFTTSEEVSETSGRGVGLDIVKVGLSSLGGFVSVESEAGKGTTFTLTLPITLAIIKALVVRVGSHRFGIPLSSLAETMSVEHGRLQSIEGRKVLNLRGEVLPVAWLRDIMNIEGDPGTERSFAVIVGFGERRMGLLVDELVGQTEVVIKGIGEYLSGVKGIAGAAEVGRHEIMLIIDVEGIIEECTTKRSALNV